MAHSDSEHRTQAVFGLAQECPQSDNKLSTMPLRIHPWAEEFSEVAMERAFGIKHAPSVVVEVCAALPINVVSEVLA